MASQPYNVGSSPQSSADATYQGTPSTNITAMSPEVGLNGSTIAAPPPYSLQPINTVAARAFVRPSIRFTPVHVRSHGRVGLSPTAAAFSPGQLNAYAQHINTSQPQSSRAPSGVVARPRGPHDLTGNVHLGQFHLPAVHITHPNQHNGTPVGQHLTVAIGNFTIDEPVTRTFKVSQLQNPSQAALLTLLPEERFPSLVGIDASEMARGVFKVFFNDIREAKQAYALAHSNLGPTCKLAFLTPRELTMSRFPEDNAAVDHDAELIISVVTKAEPSHLVFARLYEALGSVGDIKGARTIRPIYDPYNAFSFALRVEYYDIRDARTAIATFNGLRMTQDTTIFVSGYGCATDSPGTPSVESGRDALPSMTGRSTVPLEDLAHVEQLMSRVMSDPFGASRSSTPARHGHNSVSIARINNGQDVRTTVMLRNIPNKVTQAELKAYLDETSRGVYDFMYLRIDFANECNVGYAFINFVDPSSIVPFAYARASKYWNIHDSNKQAEISYATIQGRDCLIQKFRNSSVMLEHPSFRPKLLYTHPSNLAGQEERFPAPDNFSKMRRSIENAEHIGLYLNYHGYLHVAMAPARYRQQRRPRIHYITPATPRHAPTQVVDIHHPNDPFAGSAGRNGLFAPREGQQHREEQRRRKSQYDRGTPGAEYEAGTEQLLESPITAAHTLAILRHRAHATRRY